MSYDNLFFLPAVYKDDLKNMRFQQDGATCHITQANMAVLQETFPSHVISHRGDINWQRRSRDLTPLDFPCGDTRKTVFIQINLQLLST